MVRYRLQDTVIKAKQGDANATEEILKKLKPLIYSAIRRYASGWDKDDLYQEACLTVIECIKDFDPGRGIPFLAYVKKKVYFSLFNTFQRQQRPVLSLDQTHEGQDGENSTLGEQLASPEPGVEELVLTDLEIKQLYGAVGKLSPKQKQVIQMHFFEGLKYKEIARIRKSHYKSVLRLKDRALKSLRENMGNDGWE